MNGAMGIANERSGEGDQISNSYAATAGAKPMVSKNKHIESALCSEKKEGLRAWGNSLAPTSVAK